MPELPEVETVRRGLAPVMEGARLLSVEVRRAGLRLPFPAQFAARLGGRRLVSLARRAKYLLADLDDGMVLVMHLGMSGSFRIEGPEAATPGRFQQRRGAAGAHDHVVFDLSSGVRVVYNDPRRFGLMLLVPRAEIDAHPLFAALGPEPLGNGFDADTLARAAIGRRTSLKALLLDQHVVAGLGNIYVCEALFRAGLSPRRAAATLATRAGRPHARTERLVTTIREVLHDAIAAGGSSISDHSRPDGELGYFQHRFAVYDRAGSTCPRPGCGGTIRRLVQAGRSSFHCPSCQH